MFILMMSVLLEESGLITFIANWLISRDFVSGRPWILIFVLMFAAAVCTAVCLNVFLVLFLFWGIVVGICETCGYTKGDKVSTMLITAITCGSMCGGAVMTETIFAWPGIGRLVYDSVAALDYPVLQGAFIVLAITVVIMSIITDLVVAWLDPRIKLGG